MSDDTRIYRPAVRRAIGVLIMLAGGPGSGKTKSALRLATGLAEGGPIGFCDTENGRALYYADEFDFLHYEMKEPFQPRRFMEQAVIAQREGIKVWICDSFSHEHEGPGGVLAMGEAELQKLTRGDASKREQLKYTSWIGPKMEHDALMQRLWQMNCHLILCCRAKQKLELIKNDRGRTVPNPDKHDSPICAPDVPYAMTFSLLFNHANPGVPTWLKRFDKIEPLIDWNAPIDEATGARIAAWARGDKPAGVASAPPATPAKPQSQSSAPSSAAPVEDDPEDLKLVATLEEYFQRAATIKEHFELVDANIAQFAWLKENAPRLWRERVQPVVKASHDRNNPPPDQPAAEPAEPSPPIEELMKDPL